MDSSGSRRSQSAHHRRNFRRRTAWPTRRSRRSPASCSRSSPPIACRSCSARTTAPKSPRSMPAGAGLSAGIVESTVARLRRRERNCSRGWGRRSAAASYEVGDEVRDAFVSKSPHAATRIRRDASGALAVRFICIGAATLASVGVERVCGGNFDTFRDAAFLFVSPRRGAQRALRQLDLARSALTMATLLPDAQSDSAPSCGQRVHVAYVCRCTSKRLQRNTLRSDAISDATDNHVNIETVSRANLERVFGMRRITVNVGLGFRAKSSQIPLRDEREGDG